MECAVIFVELVEAFGRLVAGKGAILAPVATGDVNPAPLNKMTRKTSTRRIRVECAVGKVVFEHAKKAIESRFIAAMRGRRQQDQVPLAVLG